MKLKKDGILNIHDIQHSDQGNYTCKAENSHGNDKIVYNVFVRGKYNEPNIFNYTNYYLLLVL